MNKKQLAISAAMIGAVAIGFLLWQKFTAVKTAQPSTPQFTPAETTAPKKKKKESKSFFQKFDPIGRLFS